MAELLDPAAEFAISKAKAQLLLEHPFYASLLCSMPFQEVNGPEVATMAVDGETIFYNPAFVNSMSTNESKFVLAHEVMHCVLQHIARLGIRDPEMWNEAGDFIINDMLVTDKVGTMPKDGLFNQALVQAGKYTTDGVYALLPPKKGGTPGKKGGQPGGNPGGTEPQRHGGQKSFDELIPRKLDPQDKEKWEVRVAQAGQVAKQAGKLSVAAARLVDSLVNPKVPWPEVLRRFVSKQARTVRSFARPNRRFLSQGLYFPAMSGETLGHIVVAVDCSGSISNEILRTFATEITAIKELMRPSKMTVMYFDSKISHVEEYEVDDALDIKPHGGGGTAFSPIFKLANSFDEEPKALVVLTDLCCSDFGNVPSYPVLWVTTHKGNAPWGEIIEM